MAKFPALPLFTDAFISDTLHLTAAQTGAYLLLLMCAWRSHDCKLPDDDKILSRMARMDARQWAMNKEVIMSFWKQDANQKWYQARLLDERNFVDAKTNRQSQAGKASALKRLNRGSTTVATKHQPKSNPHTHTHTHTHTHIEDTSVSSPPIPPKPSGIDPARLEFAFQQVWGAYLGRGKSGDVGAGYKGSRKSAYERFKTLYTQTKENEREQLTRTIIDGCAKYAAFIQRAEYPSKHLSTWLNQRGWEDNYEISGTNTQTHGTVSARPMPNRDDRSEATKALAIAEDIKRRRAAERAATQGRPAGAGPTDGYAGPMLLPAQEIRGESGTDRIAGSGISVASRGIPNFTD